MSKRHLAFYFTSSLFILGQILCVKDIIRYGLEGTFGVPLSRHYYNIITPYYGAGISIIFLCILIFALLIVSLFKKPIKYNKLHVFSYFAIALLTVSILIAAYGINSSEANIMISFPLLPPPLQISSQLLGIGFCGIIFSLVALIILVVKGILSSFLRKNQVEVNSKIQG